MQKAIWCYAEGRQGRWEAICLDFDLSVQGETFEQVYRDLNQSIEMYMEYVATLPKEERGQFLGRRAPLNLRLKYVWALLWAAFKSKTNDAERAGFLVRCQA